VTDVPATTTQSSTVSKTEKKSVAPSKRKVTKKSTEDTAIVSPRPADSAAAGAAAGVAATDNGAGTGTPPSATGAGSVAPAPDANAAPAAVPPPLEQAPAETTTQKTETTVQPSHATAGWVLGGILLIGLIGVAVLTVRRRREERLSIYDRTMEPRVTVTKTLAKTTIRPTTGEFAHLPRP
jgi:hypothetical protein